MGGGELRPRPRRAQWRPYFDDLDPIVSHALAWERKLLARTRCDFHLRIAPSHARGRGSGSGAGRENDVAVQERPRRSGCSCQKTGSFAPFRAACVD
jgi:hypothetical protein